MFGQVSDKNEDTASQLFYSNNVFINRDILKKPYKFEKENHSQWLQLISAIPRPWIYINIYIYIYIYIHIHIHIHICLIL